MVSRDTADPGFTVIDNVALGMMLRGGPREQGADRPHLDRTVGLSGTEKKYPRQLPAACGSGWQRPPSPSRPGHPMDEPFGALDVQPPGSRTSSTRVGGDRRHDCSHPRIRRRLPCGQDPHPRRAAVVDEIEVDGRERTRAEADQAFRELETLVLERSAPRQRRSVRITTNPLPTRCLHRDGSRTR